MPSTLDHYNDYHTDSRFEWEGMRSSKFGRTKFFLPRNDQIKKGMDIPSQYSVRGKKHFSVQNSPEKQFRSIVRIMPKIEHWHPRQSRKKTYDMSFTQNVPRRQKGHNNPDFTHTDRFAGIRTFYNSQIREDNIKEYSVEDKMQRKRRIDQVELRRTFFSKEGEKSFF